MPGRDLSLLHDPDRAVEALTSWFQHLLPGGVLALTAFVPRADFDETMGWRVRRTGTAADGRTFVVHEAIRCDLDARLQVVFNRLETYGADGRLVDTLLRRSHLRWWPRDELSALLESLGFIDVRALGDDDGWVTTARRPLD